MYGYGADTDVGANVAQDQMWLLWPVLTFSWFWPGETGCGAGDQRHGPPRLLGAARRRGDG